MGVEVNAFQLGYKKELWKVMINVAFDWIYLIAKMKQIFAN